MRNLVTVAEDPEVVTNDGFMMFLVRNCKKAQHEQAQKVLIKAILKAFESRPASVPAAVVLAICDELSRDEACSIFAKLFQAYPENAAV